METARRGPRHFSQPAGFGGEGDHIVTIIQRQVQLIGGVLIPRFERMGVDIQRGGSLRVPQPLRYCTDIRALRDQKGGVAVAQAVQMYFRKLVLVPLQKVPEPAADGLRMDRFSIPLGKEPVILDPLVTEGSFYSVLPLAVFQEKSARSLAERQLPSPSPRFWLLCDDHALTDVL